MKTFYSRSPTGRYGFLGSALILLFVGIGKCITNGGFYLNWHVNLAVGGKYEKMFYPSNGIDVSSKSETKSVSPNFNKEGDVPNVQDEEFRTGLNELKDIVNQAQIDGKHLRAMGSRWTVTEMPYTEDYLIDTSGLNYAKNQIVNDDDVTDEYKNERKELLVFAQSGVMVKWLYSALFQKGLTLTSSMATDGQSIAGAISTGSHDAAIHFGSIQEHFKGIHLVIPGETIYVQRSSDPVLTKDYVNNTLGADRLINSDDMFNAALVSFGSFGVVHGYLLQTEKLFKLKVEAQDFPLLQVEDALYFLEPQDISNLGFTLDDDSVLPYFVQAYLNPWRLTAKDGVTVRVLQKVPLSDDELQQVQAVGASYSPTYYGRDLGLVMADVVSQRMLEFVGLFAYGPIGKAIRRVFYGFICDHTIKGLKLDREGTIFPMELFGDPKAASYYTSVPVSTNTMEVCCPLHNLGEILPLILKELDDFPALTSIDVRYTKSSNATLAPSKWGPYTTSAWISLSSLDSLATRVSYQRIYEMLADSRNIPFTYHWGKGLPRNAQWAKKSYGVDLENWKTQRKILLTTPEARYVFSSAFTDLLGVTVE